MHSTSRNNKYIFDQKELKCAYRLLETYVSTYTAYTIPDREFKPKPRCKFDASMNQPRYRPDRETGYSNTGGAVARPTARGGKNETRVAKGAET